MHAKHIHFPGKIGTPRGRAGFGTRLKSKVEEQIRPTFLRLRIHGADRLQKRKGETGATGLLAAHDRERIRLRA
jgi:hypothetical protein